MNKTTLPTTETVDQNELRTGQLLTVLIIFIALISNRWELIALQAIIFFLSVIHPVLNPYHALYRFVLRPSGLLQTDFRDDNSEASRFADFIGMIFSILATYLILMKYVVLGWSIVLLMMLLGGIASIGWCAGSFMYYMLNRLGIRGFFKRSPIGDIFPGLRPPKPMN